MLLHSHIIPFEKVVVVSLEYIQVVVYARLQIQITWDFCLLLHKLYSIRFYIDSWCSIDVQTLVTLNYWSVNAKYLNDINTVATHIYIILCIGLWQADWKNWGYTCLIFKTNTIIVWIHVYFFSPIFGSKCLVYHAPHLNDYFDMLRDTSSIYPSFQPNSFHNLIY